MVRFLTEQWLGRFSTFRGFQSTKCIEEKLFSTSKYIGKQPLFFNFEENNFYRCNNHPTSLEVLLGTGGFGWGE